ncbi:MAG: bifunctional demethylmenaquinone methyltransferase/2-methoxy-6-polyprenyl-1,4-benzoquinol methylase UbiE, partial [Patescibacteria group bacterium]
MNNSEAQWFGFERIAPDEKTNRVHSVFSSVAENYDLMNDLMSGGLHRLWKNALVARMRPREGETIIDVAGGTGDIALRLAKATKGRSSLTVCDINLDMLRVGRAKAIDNGWLDAINWVEGNAEILPFKDNSADLVCIAFGLRNVTRIDSALNEFFRVLKPGGRFFCLEFSPDVSTFLTHIYDLYSFSVLPWLGEAIAHDRAAYQYLAQSIRRFPTRDALAVRMKKTGFSNIKYSSM